MEGGKKISRTEAGSGGEKFRWVWISIMVRTFSLDEMVDELL